MFAMKYCFRLIIPLVAVCSVFTSCEVEFDPNGEWRPTTVIYGLMDQDDDTTFIRVQKGFVGVGNYLEFAKQKDSVYYKPEEIDVFMVSYYPWEKENVRDTFWFNYTETYSKPEGDFYSEKAPVYYCVTKGRLSYGEELKKEYKIIVRNNKTGGQTYATTRLIGNYDIISPNYSMRFQRDGDNYILKCQWYNINSSSAVNGEGITAKMYQPVIRFFYVENGDETYVDVPLPYKLNTSTQYGVVMKSNIYLQDILNGIKKELDYEAVRRWTEKSVFCELYINSCDLSMFEYYGNSLQQGNYLTDNGIYTNVNNGYGLFASRRRAVKVEFTETDNRFVEGLKDLNIGF